MGSIKSFYLIALLSFATRALFAQIVVEGNVSHDESPLSGVTIKVIEQNNVVRTLSANKRGRFEVDLPLNHQFQLVFYKAYMFPVSIDVNTSVTSMDVDEIVVPLNMELVYRYEEIQSKAVKRSIGVIKQVGVGEETFEFVADKEVINQVKALNKESYRLERLGREAVQAKPITVAEADDNQKPAVKLEPRDSASKQMSKSSLELELKTNVGAARNDVVAKSRELEVENKRRKSEQSSESATESAENSLEHIYSQKKILAENQSNTQKLNAENADRIAQKNIAMSHSLESFASTPPAAAGSSFKPPIVEENPGWFVSEQRLIVETNSEKINYERITYHLLLADVTYYYKNSNEISAKEYEDILTRARR